jgi:hypothetical protein
MRYAGKRDLYKIRARLTSLQIAFLPLGSHPYIPFKIDASG